MIMLSIERLFLIFCLLIELMRLSIKSHVGGIEFNPAKIDT